MKYDDIPVAEIAEAVVERRFADLRDIANLNRRFICRNRYFRRMTRRGIIPADWGYRSHLHGRVGALAEALRRAA